MKVSPLFHYFWRLGWKWRSRKAADLQVGEVFPNFVLHDLTGRAFDLSRTFPAKGAVLWFTNLCDDCRNRAILLEEICREAGDHYDVAAVSLLSEPETRRLADPWAFPVLLDPEDVVAKRLGLPHPPATCPLNNLFIVDKTGRVVFRHHLSAVNPDDFRSKWKSLMAAHKEASV